MSRKTDAELANAYALAHVEWLILASRALCLFPHHRIRLIVLRSHLAKLQARESSLGEGSRPRRRISHPPEGLMSICTPLERMAP